MLHQHLHEAQRVTEIVEAEVGGPEARAAGRGGVLWAGRQQGREQAARMLQLLQRCCASGRRCPSWCPAAGRAGSSAAPQRCSPSPSPSCSHKANSHPQPRRMSRARRLAAAAAAAGGPLAPALRRRSVRLRDSL
jgi:hypothetical protein